MSLTQLKALELTPLFNKRNFDRQLLHLKKTAVKTTKSTMRKARTRSLSTWRRQYFLSHAITDTRRAVSLNEDIFLGSIIVAIALGYGMFSAFSEILFLFLQTAFDASELTGISITIFMLMACGVIAALGGWVIAFMQNLLSIPLMEGANHKVQRSLRRTMRTSLRQTTRTASSWLLFMALIALPLAFAGSIGLTVVMLGDLPPETLINQFPTIVVATISWLVFAVMQFGLIPYIAIFESDTSVRRLVSRSSRLIQNRGRIFILIATCLTSGALFAAYKIAESIEAFIGLSKWLPFSLLTVAIITLSNSIMVLFYRKRKLARKY